MPRIQSGYNDSSFGRAEPFDLPIRKAVNRGQDATLVRAAATLLQELTERDLVVTVLVDVWNAQLWFPEEGVVAPLKSCRCSAIEPTTVSREEPL